MSAEITANYTQKEGASQMLICFSFWWTPLRDFCPPGPLLFLVLTPSHRQNYHGDWSHNFSVGGVNKLMVTQTFGSCELQNAVLWTLAYTMMKWFVHSNSVLWFLNFGAICAIKWLLWHRSSGVVVDFWPTVLSVEPMVQCLVCLSSVCPSSVRRL